MSLARKLKKQYTYADYLQWDESARVELINGEIYDMSPTPLRRHQKISMDLSVTIGVFLKNKKCSVFAAPFDVRLPDKVNVKTIKGLSVNMFLFHWKKKPVHP